MEYYVCHVCKHFRQYYKFDDKNNLVEVPSGECKLYPFYSCTLPDSKKFEVWEVHDINLRDDIYPYVKNINDSIEFLKQMEKKIEEKIKNTN